MTKYSTTFDWILNIAYESLHSLLETLDNVISYQEGIPVAFWHVDSVC